MVSTSVASSAGGSPRATEWRSSGVVAPGPPSAASTVAVRSARNRSSSSQDGTGGLLLPALFGFFIIDRLGRPVARYIIDHRLRLVSRRGVGGRRSDLLRRCHLGDGGRRRGHGRWRSDLLRRRRLGNGGRRRLGSGGCRRRFGGM